MLDANETVAAIAKEAAKPDLFEQQILLTKLRVKRLKKKGTGLIANTPKGSRKQHSNKLTGGNMNQERNHEEW